MTDNREAAPMAAGVLEPFIVKHYSADERPTIKGNGFDGLEIGEDREDAETFIAFVNAALASPSPAPQAPAGQEAYEEHVAHGGHFLPPTEKERCTYCRGRGWTDEGDPEIGSAVMACDRCTPAPQAPAGQGFDTATGNATEADVQRWLQEARAVGFREGRASMQAEAPQAPAGQGGSYADAFYELASLMGIGAQPISPARVWREQMLPKLRAALTSMQAEPQAPAGQEEAELLKLIDERDERETVIDALCDAVLGSDREEWSSAYGFQDAIDDVRDRLASPSPAPQAPAGQGERFDIAFRLKIARLLAEMHGETYLSEQQCAKYMGIDLVSWRKLEGCFVGAFSPESGDAEPPLEDSETILRASMQAEATSGADLRTFLDAAGGEGLVLGGIDAGDLYVSMYGYEPPPQPPAPLAAQGERDAERYRFLRAIADDPREWVFHLSTGTEMDSYIDSAIAAQRAQEGL